MDMIRFHLESTRNYDPAARTRYWLQSLNFINQKPVTRQSSPLEARP
jgi:hypothetical protein